MPENPDLIQRTFSLRFRNAFGIQRVVAVSTDIWKAMSVADAYITNEFPGSSPFRMVAVEEIEGHVLHVDGAEHRVVAE